MIAASPVAAQTVRFRAPQVRVTVPLGSASTTIITNLATISTNIASPVNFDVSGLPGVGASATLMDTNGNTLSAANGTTNVVLTVNTTAAIAEGLTTFNLNASGGAANSLPLILQAAHIWTGSLNSSNNWASAASWSGGVPGATSDVVFGNAGAQTNAFSGIAFTNVGIDANVTISSLRFAQTVYTDNDTTNNLHHTIQIAPSTTLTVNGAGGFSLLRDTIDEFNNPVRTMNVNFLGGAGSRMVVSNASANIAVMIGAGLRPTLNMSNLNNFSAYVSRVALADDQLYPNYRNYNDTNDFDSNPRRLVANISLPRTNVITAIYKDPNNYNNEFTRSYALSFENNESFGVGSSQPSFLELGQSNAFFLDSIALVRANTGGGTIRFNPNFTNSTLLLRSTNGGRLSLFAVSDNGGTNVSGSNVKGTVDFSGGSGTVDILADKFYVARDRTLQVSNATVNIQGDVTLGRGTTDVNVAIFGFQEHVGKTNWYAIDSNNPENRYLGYCRGTLALTNGGVFKVNGTLTLGYTADTNDVAAAQQYNTYGQITVSSNSTLMASNVIADGGLNYYDVNGRQNRITINPTGTLVVSNSIGGAPGLPLDRLSISAGTITLFVTAGRTNAFVRDFQNPGSLPSAAKIASLTGVTSYPTNIPLISYETATPFMAADMSAIGGGVQGYIINNTDNKTIDLFVTTNAPKNLIWRGNNGNQWDLTTKNWGLVTGGPDTNFAMGDIVTFNDSSSVNSIDITTVVVPNQTAGTNGVTIATTNRNYTFNNSVGAIAGTALMVKSGPGNLTFNATEAGPINILGGTVDGNGFLGTTTVGSNAFLNFSGAIVGGLTSTGRVAIVSGGSVASGAVNIRGGSFTNYGYVNASGSMVISGGAFVTNAGSAEIDVDTGSTGGNWVMSGASTLANEGLIKLVRGRLNVAPSAAPFDGGFLYGTGRIQDIDGGLGGTVGLPTGNDGRLGINPTAIFSPGATPSNSIGTFHADARIDLSNPNGDPAKLLIEVDLSQNPPNDIVACDRWNNITGLLIFTNINPGAGTFTAGQVFTIFQNNNGANYPNFIDVNGTYPVISPPVPGPGLQWGLFNFRTYGTISVTNSPLVWNGTPDGNWDFATANWQGAAVYADNQGAVFDDTASGTTTITLITNVAPAGWPITTNIVPNVSTNFFTNGPAMSPGVVFNNSAQNYTIRGNGRITGITSLYKTGSGTLSLFTTNDFIGNVMIDGGTLAVTNAGGGNNVVALGVAGGGSMQNEVIINGATLRYVGTTNANLNNFVIFNPGGATVEVTSSAHELTLSKNVFGPGGLTKTGSGTLVLSQNGSAYAGGTTISAGILRMTAAAAGTGGITIANSSTLNLTNSFTFTNGVNVSGSATTIRVLSNSIPVSSGAWTGNGGVTISNGSTFVFNGSLAGFGGTVSFGNSVGTFRFNNATNANNCLGSAAATFDLGTGSATLSNLNGGNLTYDLGALAGGASTILAGRSTNVSVGNTTYSIGANGSNTTFNGRIMNGLDTVSVTKVGTGTLLLNGNNTYGGLTTVSAGTLGGTGTIAGQVTVQAGGTLAPGASIGTLTINNSLSLAGTTSVEVSRNGGTLTSDKVVGLTSVTFGGSLVVSNVGPDALLQGNSFQLFNLGGSGSFSSITPALTGGLSWRFNTANGVLTVVGPTLNVVNNGGVSLTFSWSESGFKLQAQTNSINVGISNNWSDYPGGGTSGVTVPIDVANGTVFFRLLSTP